jgi:hypothetical protein
MQIYGGQRVGTLAYSIAKRDISLPNCQNPDPGRG